MWIAVLGLFVFTESLWGETISRQSDYLVSLSDTLIQNEVSIISSSWKTEKEQEAFLQMVLNKSNSDLQFAGYCVVGDVKPDPVENKAYLALETGIIFGQSVEALDLLIGNGVTFDVLVINEIKNSIILLPEPLNISNSAALLLQDDLNVGVTENQENYNRFLISVVDGTDNDSLMVLTDEDGSYYISNTGGVSQISAAYEVKDGYNNNEFNTLTVINHKDANNVKVVEGKVDVDKENIPPVVDGIDFGEDADFFISSSTGDDSNDGLSASKPKKTFAAVIGLKPASGSAIAFKAGDTIREVIGTSSSLITTTGVTFKAYGVGAKPVVSGADLITGWTKYSGNIYRTKVETEPIVVLANGEPMSVARLPKKGWYSISSTTASTNMAAKELDGGIDYVGATAVIRYYEYEVNPAVVTSQASQTLTTNNTTSIKAGKGFVLFGKLSFLTEANEWFYDKTNKYLYVWTPDGASPDNYKIEAAQRDHGIVAAKASTTIENLSIVGANYAGVYARSSNSTVLNCDLKYCYIGFDAMSGSYSGNVIDGCTFMGMYRHGAIMQSRSPKVVNSSFENIGLLKYWGAITKGRVGMAVYYGNSSIGVGGTVEYNTIKNTAYSGIRVDCPGSKIRYNYVENAVSDLSDGGAIYTWGYDNDGTIISHNIIRNCNNPEAGYPSDSGSDVGIYCDDHSEEITVANNVIENCKLGVYIHNGYNCIVQDNLLFDNHVGMADLRGSNLLFDYSKTTYSNNKIVATDEVGVNYWFASSYQTMMALQNNVGNTYSGNRYYHNTKENIFSVSSAEYDFARWQSITGSDKDSEVVLDYHVGNEELYYNDTKNDKIVSLSGKYTDIDGNPIGSFTLKPFTGKIVVKLD